jgi:phosphomannomutase
MTRTWIDIHIDEVLNLPLVDVEAVKAAKFKVVVDGVNSWDHHPKIIRVMGVEVVKYTVNPTDISTQSRPLRAPD